MLKRFTGSSGACVNAARARSRTGAGRRDGSHISANVGPYVSFVAVTVILPDGGASLADSEPAPARLGEKLAAKPRGVGPATLLGDQDPQVLGVGARVLQLVEDGE